jgi:hypothetical protein
MALVGTPNLSPTMAATAAADEPAGH